MLDVMNDADRGSLRQALTYSQQAYMEHLEQFTDAMRYVAGSHYGRRGAGTQNSQLFPLAGLYTRIIGRLLQPDEPRAHVSHWNPELDADCHELKLMLNDEFERIDLAQALAETGNQSMYGFGVMKVGRIVEGGLEEQGGLDHDVGGLFADPVLNEDFIFDMRAKRWKGVMFMGDLNRVSLDWARKNTAFRKKGRDNLTASNRLSDIPFLGTYRRIRSQLLQAPGMQPLEDEYEDMIDLWQLWLPREGKIVVCDRNVENILSVEDWTGPPRGPYHILGYSWLPGNLVPLSPLSDLLDLHIAANNLGNAVGDDAENAKTVVAASGPTGEKDGNAVIDSPNRGVVTVGDVNSLKPMNFNFASGQLWALAVNMIDRFVYFGGNLDAIGGLSPQSATIGQDRLLLESASRQAQEMQGEMMKFTQRIMQDLAWYIKTDPEWRRQLQKDVGYAGIKVPFEATPDRIAGDISEYRVRIEPYSSITKTPSQRMALLRQIMTETVIPLMPMMQEQGIGLNIEKMLKKIAEYSDLSELSDILVYSQGETTRPAGQGEDDEPMKPPVTTRKYIRENRSTATRTGKDNALVASLLGADQQDSEAAASIG